MIAPTIRKGNNQPIRDNILVIAPIPGHVGVTDQTSIIELADALKVAA
jgi:hypothetical protein